MTLRKHLRMCWAIFNQDWGVYKCSSCDNVWYLSGEAPDMRGLICESCESKEFDKWLEDYNNKLQGAA